MEKIPLPTKMHLTPDGENPHRATLIIEPLFSGYAATIGNALRRVLLSSMPGAAVTALKIEGVQHEFATIDGVVEDVVQLILNFKQLRLKVHSEEEVRFTFKASGTGEVTAGDIAAPSDVEVINKDLHLATLSDKNAKLEIEIFARRGRGYTPSEARDAEKEIGVIAIDAVFTPIVNVGFQTENVRVGRMTNFERVMLDITTDGSMTPKEAVALSASILVDHFQLLIEGDLEPQTERPAKEEELVATELPPVEPMDTAPATPAAEAVEAPEAEPAAEDEGKKKTSRSKKKDE